MQFIVTGIGEFVCRFVPVRTGCDWAILRGVASPKLLVAVLALVLLAGCGDEASTTAPSRPGAPLTAQERAGADRAVAAIRAYCRGVARYLAGRAGPPPVEGAVAAARRIAALARARPEASYRGSQRARDLAADLAEDLEGTNCSQRLVAELSRGL
jgi:hypothetical protein